MDERSLQAAVVDLAHLYGWRVASFRAALNGRGQWSTPVSADGAGWVDLVLVRDRVLFVELKSDKGRLSSEQVRWATALQAAGATWCCWRPSTWTDGTIRSVLSAPRLAVAG